MPTQKIDAIKKVDWTEVLRDRVQDDSIDLPQPFTFREILGKPSAAIRAMCQGLMDGPVRIDMGTYGSNKKWTPLSRYVSFTEESVSDKDLGVCYGCAATCAVLNVLPHVKSSYALLYVVSDLVHFEFAIDCLRRGYPAKFLDYFECRNILCMLEPYRQDLKYLRSNFKSDDLIAYLALADGLEELGY